MVFVDASSFIMSKHEFKEKKSCVIFVLISLSDGLQINNIHRKTYQLANEIGLQYKKDKVQQIEVLYNKVNEYLSEVLPGTLICSYCALHCPLVHKMRHSSYSIEHSVPYCKKIHLTLI